MRIIWAESAKIGTKMPKTAEVNAAKQEEGSKVGDVGTALEEATAEMMEAQSAPLRDMRSTDTLGQVVFSTRIVGILMQTKQKSSLTNKPMGPTRFTRTSTSTALRRLGEGIMAVQDAGSKAVARGAAEEEGSKGGVDLKAAGAEAEGGTIIKGTTSKEIRVVTIKEITRIRGTTMIITTMEQEGAPTQGLPRDKVKIVGETNMRPKEGIKHLRDTISTNLSR